jgi:hypothetical protein
MRHLTFLCGVLLLAVPAYAQSVAPATATAAGPAGSGAASAPGAAPHRQTMRERFAEANTTHDGHLTLAQAQAGFPAMARLFDAIDRDHKGYLTMDDIHAYYEAKRAARHASN